MRVINADWTLRVLMALAAVLLWLPATANAEWGSNCNPKYHCYALAAYSMSGGGGGGGEEVMGLDSEIVTEAMNVPLWEYGEGESAYFVSNEQWMRAPKGNWVEDGQLAGDKSASEEGREVNGKSLHWFYAFDNGVSEGQKWFQEYVAPWTYPGWTPETYSLADPNRNGTWCEYINGPQVNCDDNYAMYATDVEIGMEADEEVQPETLGYVANTGVENQWGEWEYWKKAELETVRKMGRPEGEYVCAEKIASHPGYISFGTPANKCFS